MDVAPEQAAEQITSLQRSIDDLVSVLALPAMGTGTQPSQIANPLLDALLGVLQLDVVYARLKDPEGGAPLEMLRVTGTRNLPALPQEFGELLNRSLGSDPQNWPSVVRHFLDDDISLVSLRVGIHGEEDGVIVAGSAQTFRDRRKDCC